MLSTPILDSAIGLIFTFLAVSLAAGAVTEALASMLKWRSRTLLAGVKALLNDRRFNGLALEVYNHALVNPRSDGTTQAGRKPKFFPAYIDANHFAAAFADVLGISAQANDAIPAAIAKLDANGNKQIAGLLQGIYNRAGNDLAAVESGLSQWFDSGMDRVSGAYKRRTQLISFLTGLVIAVSLNVSAIRVALALWDQPALAKAVTAEISQGLSTAAPAKDTDPAAIPATNDVLKKFEAMNLPIGWIPDEASAGTLARNDIFAVHPPSLSRENEGWWLTTILGWLITAGATLFGAPFWYDTLQQFVRLKGAGPSPAEKSRNKAAAA
jgi:hypothetical protein